MTGEMLKAYAEAYRADSIRRTASLAFAESGVKALLSDDNFCLTDHAFRGTLVLGKYKIYHIKGECLCFSVVFSSVSDF